MKEAGPACEVLNMNRKQADFNPFLQEDARGFVECSRYIRPSARVGLKGRFVPGSQTTRIVLQPQCQPD